MPQADRSKIVKEKVAPIPVRQRRLSPRTLIPYPWHQAIFSLQANALSTMCFNLPIVPISLNSQYIRTRKGFQMGLAPAILELRRVTKEILAGQKKWEPTGVISAVILFYSPLWVTKANCVREMDVDNKIKSILDAWQNATGISDARIWTVMAGKIQASEKKTAVYLFDMGDVIDAV